MCGDVAADLRPAFGVVPRETEAPATGATSSAIWVAGMILFTSSIRAGGTVVLAEKEVGMGFPRVGRGWSRIGTSLRVHTPINFAAYK
jgi:hypothetical protein